jgi:hypothetical protein
MSAPDYEALAKTMQCMADNLDDNAHTDPDLGVSEREDMIRDASLIEDVAAALRRAARIEPYVAHRPTCLTQIGPDHSGFRGKMTYCDCGLREALDSEPA